MSQAAMLTLPAVDGSCLRANKRYRLPDSDVTVAQIQVVLQQWWAACGVRDTSYLLSAVKQWGRGALSASELCSPLLYSVVHGMSSIDPTIHPRHSRLVAALLAEHGKQPCMSAARRCEYEAMECSRLLLKAFTKYRELAKEEPRRRVVLGRASLEHQQRLAELLGRIRMPFEAVGAAPDAPHRLVHEQLGPQPAVDDGLAEFDELAASLGPVRPDMLTYITTSNQ